MHFSDKSTFLGAGLKMSLWGLCISSVSFAANPPAHELAKINDAVISTADFEAKYKESLRFFRFKAPTRKNVLDEMVNRELAIQEAKKLGIDKDPEVRDRIETVLYHSLLDKKLGSKFENIQISDKELEAFYQKNPEVRTSHIFVQLRPDANKAQEKVAFEKIKTAEAELKKGERPFAEIAKTYSEGVPAMNGGDIDYQPKDKLDPTYYQTAVGLKKVGAVSPVIRTQFGLHIVKLTGIHDFKDIDKAYFKRMIFDEKRTEIFEHYIAELKQKSSVNVNYGLLKNDEAATSVPGGAGATRE